MQEGSRPFELGAGQPRGQTTARGPRNQWIHPCKGWGAGGRTATPMVLTDHTEDPPPPPKTRSLQPTDLLRGRAPPREATGP